MPKLPVIAPKKLVKILTHLGFYFKHSVGSHHVFKHPDGRRVTVTMHNKDLPKGTLLAILDDMKISKEELINLL